MHNEWKVVFIGDQSYGHIQSLEKTHYHLDCPSCLTAGVAMAVVMDRIGMKDVGTYSAAVQNVGGDLWSVTIEITGQDPADALVRSCFVVGNGTLRKPTEIVEIYGV